MMTLGFSPCPNDTFAFHALVHGLVGDLRFEVRIEDVETLNGLAEKGLLDVVKVSVAAFGRIRENYWLLRSGGAAGFGTGPIVVAKSARPVGGLIAVPGERTTAALLLRLLGRFETVPMPFHRIEDAVLKGDADCGVLIHEGRFTYQKRGLVMIADLGREWERRQHVPVSLGAVAMRRSLGQHIARKVDAAIRASVDHAMRHPEVTTLYVAGHAQEMDPATIRRHIDLYVNDYTLALDEDAVLRLLAWGEEQGMFPRSPLPVFAY